MEPIMASDTAASEISSALSKPVLLFRSHRPSSLVSDSSRIWVITAISVGLSA